VFALGGDHPDRLAALREEREAVRSDRALGLLGGGKITGVDRASVHEARAGGRRVVGRDHEPRGVSQRQRGLVAFVDG